ncbi:MAG: hypothetical protein H0Z39_08105 [Peptococcaceae bacterium]|nr:hypothetical protein [Peptococcaceae bacterium]
MPPKHGITYFRLKKDKLSLQVFALRSLTRHLLSRQLPAGFVVSLTAVSSREAPAESFDKPPPRHPALNAGLVSE